MLRDPLEAMAVDTGPGTIDDMKHAHSILSSLLSKPEASAIGNTNVDVARCLTGYFIILHIDR